MATNPTKNSVLGSPVEKKMTDLTRDLKVLLLLKP